MLLHASGNNIVQIKALFNLYVLQAVYSGDGEWYEATVKGVSDTGDFVVSFDAYEHEEAVRPGPVCHFSIGHGQLTARMAVF